MALKICIIPDIPFLISFCKILPVIRSYITFSISFVWKYFFILLFHPLSCRILDFLLLLLDNAVCLFRLLFAGVFMTDLPYDLFGLIIILIHFLNALISLSSSLSYLSYYIISLANFYSLITSLIILFRNGSIIIIRKVLNLANLKSCIVLFGAVLV